MAAKPRKRRKKKQLPIVWLSNHVLGRLVAQSTGAAGEGGGLLIGRRNRAGNFEIVEELSLRHFKATQWHIWYDKEEMAAARVAAYNTYGPCYEPVGGWHVHPWKACTAEALVPAITEDDIGCMFKNEIEMPCITFPDPGYSEPTEHQLWEMANGKACRIEAWFKISRGKALPCRMRKKDLPVPKPKRKRR